MDQEEISKAAMEYLQSVFDADPSATHALMVNRVPTNQAMIEHPTAICEAAPFAGDPNDNPVLGLLGVFNGFLSRLGLPADHLIAMKWRNDSSEDHPVFTGFQHYTPPLNEPNKDLAS